MNCCLCDYFIEDEKNLHVNVLAFRVCIACEDDMDIKTRIAYKRFVKNLVRQILPQKPEEIKIDPFF